MQQDILVGTKKYFILSAMDKNLFIYPVHYFIILKVIRFLSNPFIIIYNVIISVRNVDFNKNFIFSKCSKKIISKHKVRLAYYVKELKNEPLFCIFERISRDSRGRQFGNAHLVGWTIRTTSFRQVFYQTYVKFFRS